MESFCARHKSIFKKTKKKLIIKKKRKKEGEPSPFSYLLLIIGY